MMLTAARQHLKEPSERSTGYSTFAWLENVKGMISAIHRVARLETVYARGASIMSDAYTTCKVVCHRHTVVTACSICCVYFRVAVYNIGGVI